MLITHLASPYKTTPPGSSPPPYAASAYDKKRNKNMRRIDFSYPELLSNIVKRLLLLIGKFAGYKGAAVLIATMLLCKGYVGEAAWASVIISALCGFIMPKTLGTIGEKQNDSYFSEFNNRASGTDNKPSASGRKTISEGKQRIREAVESAGRNSDCDT